MKPVVKSKPNLQRQSRYFADPLIIPRVEKYLEDTKDEPEVDIDALVDHLRSKFREYRNKKFAPFRANVGKALNYIMGKHGLSVENSSDFDSEDRNAMWEGSRMVGEEEEEDVGFDSDELEEVGPVQGRDEDDVFDDDDVYDDEDDDEEEEMGATLRCERDINSESEPESIQHNINRGNMNGIARFLGGNMNSVMRSNVSRLEKAYFNGNKNQATNATEELINISSDEETKDPKPKPSQIKNSSQNGNATVSTSIKKSKNWIILDRNSRITSSQSPGTLKKMSMKKVDGKKINKSTAESSASEARAKALEKQKFSSIYNSSDITFKDVGGYSKILKDIRELVIHLKLPKIYQSLGVNPPRGFLLHGPSGTGKTHLAHALAGELGVPMIRVAAQELVSGLSGGSEERIRELFKEARILAPCIVFLDEIDAVTARRETAQKQMERRIVTQLITSLDELNDLNLDKEIIVIGATNRPDSIDPALRRAGRFDREICLGIPDRKARREILGLLSQNVNIASDVSLDKIAMATPGYVGADLKALLTEAGMSAVSRIVERKLKELEAKEAEKNVQEVEMKRPETCEEELDADRTASGEPAPKKQKTDDKEVSSSQTDATSSVEGGVSGLTNTASDSAPVVDLEPKQDSQPDESTSEKVQSKSTKATDDDVKILSCNKIDRNQLKSAVNKRDSEEESDEEDEADTFKFKWKLSPQELDSLRVENSDFTNAMKKVQPSAKREGFATVPDVTWDDVGSLQDIRHELKMTILAPVKYPTAFSSLGLTAASGILLCGPPGCGKTLLAKALANEAGINFISVKGPELLNMYVGESERAVRQCFVRARTSQPCVIFFDEIDALCPKRSDFGDGGASSRVVNQLLTEMDGVEERTGVFVMAASNRPDILDPAVLRPGRIDKILYVGLPSPADRVDILRALTKNGTRPTLAPDVSLGEVGTSELCTGFTGADLSSLVHEAGIQALREFIDSRGGGEGEGGRGGDDEEGVDAVEPQLIVAARHFNAALNKIKPSVSQKDQIRYEELKLKYSASPVEQNMEISE